MKKQKSSKLKTCFNIGTLKNFSSSRIDGFIFTQSSICIISGLKGISKSRNLFCDIFLNASKFQLFNLGQLK